MDSRGHRSTQARTLHTPCRCQCTQFSPVCRLRGDMSASIRRICSSKSRPKHQAAYRYRPSPSRPGDKHRGRSEVERLPVLTTSTLPSKNIGISLHETRLVRAALKVRPRSRCDSISMRHSDSRVSSVVSSSDIPYQRPQKQLWKTPTLPTPVPHPFSLSSLLHLP